MKLSFGKYNGWDITAVPDDYVEYMITSNEKSLKMFRDEQERRIAVTDAKLPMMARIIQAGYRTLANQNHPDKGGSTSVMQEINAANEKLKVLIERR